MIAGVDGIPGGWLVALVEETAVDWAVCADAAEVLRVTADCTAVGVDVPMGLPAAGYRACDLAARELLGGARSSVFFTPPRAVLGADPRDYAEVCRVARAVSGKAVSKQLFHILDRIADWDGVLPRANVLEVHPEVSFRTLAPGVPFDRKRSALGAGQRLVALASFVDIPAAFARIGASRAMLDDALDALAVAFSAGRWAAGTAVQLGTETDDRGLPMRIVA